MRRQRLLAALLLAPALILVVACLVVPLLLNLSMAVRDPEMPQALPRTTAVLRDWNGRGLPPEAAFAAATQELAAADAAQRIGALVSRLNFARSGFRSLLIRAAHAEMQAPYQMGMAALDPRWSDTTTWRVLRQAASPITPLYFLRSLDLDLSATGDVVQLPADQSIFRRLFVRTLWISVSVTVLVLLIGFPVAYTLTTLRGTWARIGIALVLVPFWISILVRTTAWFILLQREGPLNKALIALGIVDAPVQLIFTRFAVDVAMVHVLLPFAIMPMYSVMRRIDGVYVRAAASLGAAGWTRFVRVYLPMTLPGVAAGALITFMLAIGFYVTPALVGGTNDQMVSSFIAEYANETLNFGMAAALAILLLAMTAIVVGAGRLLLPRRV